MKANTTTYNCLSLTIIREDRATVRQFVFREMDIRSWLPSASALALRAHIPNVCDPNHGGQSPTPYENYRSARNVALRLSQDRANWHVLDHLSEEGLSWSRFVTTYLYVHRKSPKELPAVPPADRGALGALDRELCSQGLDDEVQVSTCGCLGLCDDGPIDRLSRRRLVSQSQSGGCSGDREFPPSGGRS